MDKEITITINGWRPWVNDQKSGVRVITAPEHFLENLRQALEALYLHEKRKYEREYDINLPTGEANGNLLLPMQE